MLLKATTIKILNIYFKELGPRAFEAFRAFGGFGAKDAQRFLGDIGRYLTVDLIIK